LKTIQSIPSALPRSFVLSVLPVPAGPAGAAPNLIYKAPVIVIQHLSVRGVMTNLVVAPKYSYPYLIVAFTCLTIQAPSESSSI